MDIERYGILLLLIIYSARVGDGYMPEVRVTIDEKLDSFLDKIVASGLYPSKAEFMRCGIIHLLKDFDLIEKIINT